MILEIHKAIILLLYLPSLSSYHFHGHNSHHNVTIEALTPMLRSATYVAELSQPPRTDGTSIWDNMGHVYDVPEQVIFYARASLLPGVKTICETGFNAGHSAITFLSTNLQANLVTFDLGDMPWTSHSVKYIQYVYTNRFQYVKGPSKDTLNQSNMKDKKCDLMSIDGDHDHPIIDILAFRKLSYPGAYLLMDDYTNSFPKSIEAWDSAVSQGIIETIECRRNYTVVHNLFRGWCFGRFK